MQEEFILINKHLASYQRKTLTFFRVLSSYQIIFLTSGKFIQILPGTQLLCNFCSRSWNYQQKGGKCLSRIIVSNLCTESIFDGKQYRVIFVSSNLKSSKVGKAYFVAGPFFGIPLLFDIIFLCSQINVQSTTR